MTVGEYIHSCCAIVKPRHDRETNQLRFFLAEEITLDGPLYYTEDYLKMMTTTLGKNWSIMFVTNSDGDKIPVGIVCQR